MISISPFLIGSFEWNLYRCILYLNSFNRYWLCGLFLLYSSNHKCRNHYLLLYRQKNINLFGLHILINGLKMTTIISHIKFHKISCLCFHNSRTPFFVVKSVSLGMIWVSNEMTSRSRTQLILNGIIKV